LQIEEPVTLQNLLTYPEIFITDSADTDVAELLTQVKDLLRQAVAELIAMRRREGEFITRELQSHLQFILEKCSEIEKLSQQSRQEYFTKYQQSLAELCQNCQLDENRLIQEAGILAKKIGHYRGMHPSAQSHSAIYLTITKRRTGRQADEFFSPGNESRDYYHWGKIRKYRNFSSGRQSQK